MADRINAEAFIAPTFGQRFGGRLLDGLITFPVFLALHVALSGAGLRAVVFVIAAAYEIVGISVWGQTIGKRIVGTRVVSVVSDELQPAQAVVRFVAYGGIAFVFTTFGLFVVAELWAFLVIAPIIRPPLHRGLHDLAARTIVVPTRTWSAK